MSDLAEIREITARALNELSSAERVYQDKIQTLENDIQSTRHRIIDLDDDIERTVINLCNRIEAIYTQSGRILNELRLSRSQPDTYNLPANIDIHQALELMRSLASMGEETITELDIKSQTFIAERKKWWKFW